MSRKSMTVLVLITLLLLSCNLVNRALTPDLPPEIDQIQTQLPQIETMIPDITLEVESISTIVPDVGGLFNPQDPPLGEWKGLPIMPQATAGFDDGSNSYAFKAPVTVDEAVKFYEDVLKELGWSSLFPAQSSETGSLLIFMKDSQSLTITITSSGSGEEIHILLLLT